MNCKFNITLILSAMLFCTLARAQHKCVVAGKTSYQDTPCAADSINNPKPITPKPSFASKPKPMSIEQLKDDEKARKASLEATMRTAPAYIPPIALSSESENMRFALCQTLTMRMIGSVGAQNARVIMDSSSMSTTRICTNDGSVLITCTAADNKMITTKSPYPC